MFVRVLLRIMKSLTYIADGGGGEPGIVDGEEGVEAAAKPLGHCRCLQGLRGGDPR